MPQMMAQEKLDLVYTEMNQIEIRMNEEKGLLSSDPCVLRLQELWKEADALENEIFDFGTMI